MRGEGFIRIIRFSPIVLLLILIFAQHYITASPEGFLLTNQTHDGIVTAIAIDAQGQTGFSGDSRGVIRVWDSNTRTIIQLLRIGTDPIVKLAAHPEKTEIAVVVEQDAGSYRLSIWDWKSRSIRSTHNIDNFPSFMTYSPQGNFLALSFPQRPSLYFYDTEQSLKIPWLEEGFGIVTSFVISNSEIRLMAYNAAEGSIKYVELETAVLAHEVQTERGFNHLTLLKNRRYALGYKNRELYLIDLLNGAILARRASGEIGAILPFNSDKNQFYVVEQRDREHQLRIVNVNIDNVFSITIQTRTAVTIRGIDISYAASGGRIFLTRNRHETALLENNKNHILSVVETQKIQNILIQDEWLYLQTAAGMSRILLALLQDPVQQNIYIAPEEGEVVEEMKLPFSNPAGITGLGNGKFITWPRNEIGHIYIYDDVQAEFRQIPIPLRAPIKHAHSGNRYISILDYSDGLYLLDRLTYEQVLIYENLGMNDVIELSDGHIVIGKNKTNFLNTSLIEVDTVTAETSIRHGDDDVVLALEPYPRGFFTLGIENLQESFTTIRQFSENNAGEGEPLEPPEPPRLIMRFAADSEGNDFHFIPETETLVVSNGLSGLRMYRNRSLETLKADNDFPLKIYGNKQFIITVNIDGSTAVWDLSTKQLKYRHIILSDNTIVQLFSNYSYISLNADSPSDDGTGSGGNAVSGVSAGSGNGNSREINFSRILSIPTGADTGRSGEQEAESPPSPGGAGDPVFNVPVQQTLRRAGEN